MDILFYFATGLCAGFLAGLLGVGGGLVIVPALLFVFTTQHFPVAYALHLALGTSLASIAFTSLSSMREHHRHGAVQWPIVKTIAPGILIGTLCGALLAARIDAGWLRLFFIVFLFVAATQIFFNLRPAGARALPGRFGLSLAGGIIGLVSSWVGIGGGTLTVPFLLWCSVGMRQAVGTSAAVGFPIAIAGTIGYMIGGMSQPGLPTGSLGMVYLPALLPLVLASMLLAPAGARLAHRMPVAKLKKIFALLLYFLGTRMAFGSA
ncbi:MAG: sulfite exporter TauE/SafE family protein [Pseudomonadota bacterium]